MARRQLWSVGKPCEGWSGSNVRRWGRCWSSLGHHPKRRPTVPVVDGDRASAGGRGVHMMSCVVHRSAGHAHAHRWCARSHGVMRRHLLSRLAVGRRDPASRLHVIARRSRRSYHRSRTCVCAEVLVAHGCCRRSERLSRTRRCDRLRLQHPRYHRRLLVGRWDVGVSS